LWFSIFYPTAILGIWRTVFRYMRGTKKGKRKKK